MDREELVAMVMEALQENGNVVITQDWIKELVSCLHLNVDVINKMNEIEKERGGLLCEHFELLAQRISHIAFTVENVAHAQE